MGIEPTSKAWEALILPLNYARSSPKTLSHPASAKQSRSRQLQPINLLISPRRISPRTLRLCGKDFDLHRGSAAVLT
jgi:hypothetical protein